MKPIRFTRHARERLPDRGTTEEEVIRSVREGLRESVREGRYRCRLNLQYRALWQGRHYEIKQVAPVIVEEEDAIVVITVYTFYY